MKKLFLTAGAVLVAGGLLTGCGAIEQQTPKKSVMESPQPAPAKEAKVYKVGETVKVKGTEVTIVKAEFVDANKDKPSTNGAILNLEVVGKNTGSKDYWILSTLNFALYDQAGNKLKDYYDVNRNMLSGEIKQGAQNSGELLFDVKKEATYTLVYTPDFVNGEEVKFNIEVK